MLDGSQCRHWFNKTEKGGTQQEKEEELERERERKSMMKRTTVHWLKFISDPKGGELESHHRS